MLAQFSASVWNSTCHLAPWLLLGAGIAGLIYIVLPGGWLARRFAGRKGIFKAVLLGVPLPLCSCGVIPAGIGLRRQGAGDPSSIAFLISTPQTGVDSILVSASFLGWPFAVAKVAIAALTGVIGGLLTRDRGLPSEGETDPSRAMAPPRRRDWRAALAHALELIQSIWLWLIVGVVLSAVIELFVVPTDWFQGLRGASVLWSMLIVLAISIPMYVCATASVPIAAALVAGGMPAGAAMVFLIGGPATNIATIGAVYREFGTRNLVVYLATLIGGSMAGGLLFESCLSAAPDGASLHAGHPHEGPGWVEQLSAMVLAGILIRCAWLDLQRWFRSRNPVRADDAAPLSSYPVTGMNCQSCVSRIEKELAKIPEIGPVRVDLERGLVVVSGSADADTVRSGIRAAGFQSPAPQA